MFAVGSTPRRLGAIALATAGAFLPAPGRLSSVPWVALLGRSPSRRGLAPSLASDPPGFPTPRLGRDGLAG